MERVKTKHFTKNYAVYKDGRYFICKSYGVPVARCRTYGNGIIFTDKWNYSPTTINHVKWFLKEYAGISERVTSIKNLRRCVQNGIIPVLDEDFGVNVYNVYEVVK